MTGRGLRGALAHAAPTGNRRVLWALLAAVLLELVTAALRFGCGLEATRDTASALAPWTLGVRIHHGYVGVLLLALAPFLARTRPAVSSWSAVLGASLILSDLVHHFVVLWIFLGDPEFHLTY